MRCTRSAAFSGRRARRLDSGRPLRFAPKFSIFRFPHSAVQAPPACAPALTRLIPHPLKSHSHAEAFHSRSRSGLRQNLCRTVPADDRPPRRRVQKTLRVHSPAAAGAFRHEAARVSFDLLRVGRYGRGHSQSHWRRQGAQLHVWRVFGQVVRRLEKVREGSGRAPGRVGPAHPRRADPRPVAGRRFRCRDAHPQRNLHGRHVAHRGNRRRDARFPRDAAHRR